MRTLNISACVVLTASISAQSVSSERLEPVFFQASGQQEVVTLRNLPREMVRLHRGDGWQDAVYSNAPGATRTALPLKNCRQPADMIDLRRARMNGFTVVGYQISSPPGPKGYKLAADSGVRPYRRDGNRLLNTRNPAEIDVIDVSPDVWVLDIPAHGKIKRMGCTAGWSMTINVIGPKGINPITGQPQ